jgi:hypothetical protein
MMSKACTGNDRTETVTRQYVHGVFYSSRGAILLLYIIQPEHSATEATRSNGVKHSTPASPAVHLSVNTSTSATNLASPQHPQSSSNFAATPTAVHPEDNLGTPTHSTNNSKGGILGYLKSSIGILGIGSPKPSTVVPHTVTEPAVSDQGRCTLASNLTNTDIMSLEGGVDLNDGDSVFTNGSMFCSPTGQVQVSDGSGSTPQQQQVSQHLVLSCVVCFLLPLRQYH